jgi:hypothetical protein
VVKKEGSWREVMGSKPLSEGYFSFIWSKINYKNFQPT